MSSRDDIFSRSPLDRVSLPVLGQARTAPAAATSWTWKPSRFNVQTTTAEGWLLLWNTYTGSMNAFRPEQRPAVLDLISRKGVSGGKRSVASYLADRGYLVEQQVDELRRVQYAFGKENHRSDKLELILLASEDCNFRCTYCYEDFQRGTMRPEVRAAVKRLVESRLDGLRELKVSWFGGEPLYGLEAIEDLAPFFAEVAERKHLHYFSHMTTNAYLLTEEVAAKLLSWRVTDFQITLDGLPEDHDRHRMARDGSGTFDTIFRNLVHMSERSEQFTVAIRVNFDRSNAPGLERFLDLLKPRFAGDERFIIELHSIGKWGGANDGDLPVCGRDESHAIQTRLKAAARSLGLNVSGGWQPGAGVGTEVCYAARPYNFIVGATGDLMKCTIDLDKQDHNIVGRLLPDGSLDLDTDKMALWTEPAFERDTGCQRCHVLPACQGIHCPKVRIDHGIRPCAGVRRTAKQEMAEFFASKQAVLEVSRADPGEPAGGSAPAAVDSHPQREPVA